MTTTTACWVDPAFARVREVFESHFTDDSPYREVGAGLSVYAEGRLVVNLWGGVADEASGRAFAADTLVHVFSTTKSLPAMAVAQLVDEGCLDYDEPLARHWPEFAANGKASVTLAHVLSHQSGVNAFELPTSVEELCDWELVTTRLAAQAPFCAPGEQTAYHAFTLGWLAMEVVRRVTGLMPRDYVAQRIAGPLQADIGIGVAEADWPRVASLVPPPPPPSGAMPSSIHPQGAKAVSNPLLAPRHTATPTWRRAQVPAVNAYSTADGIARVFAAMAQRGSFNGCTLLSAAAVERLRAPLSTRPCLMQGPIRWGGGVILSDGGQFGPLDTTFGNCGFGGSMGFANSEVGVAVGYTPNRLYPGGLRDPRGMALAAAVFECVSRAGA